MEKGKIVKSSFRGILLISLLAIVAVSPALAAPKAPTVAQCAWAAVVAGDVKNFALKSGMSERDARRAGRRTMARLILQKLNPSSDEEYSARETCANALTGPLTSAVGKLGKIALEGLQ